MDEKESLTANIELPPDDDDKVEVEHYQNKQLISNNHNNEAVISDLYPRLQQDVTILIDEESQKIPLHHSGIAWLSLLFCCFPLSLVAVYKSDKVIKLIRRGDLQNARIESEIAKKISWLAIIFGATIVILSIAIYFVVVYDFQHKL